MSKRTVLPEKLTVAQLLIQFPAFYRTCKFITPPRRCLHFEVVGGLEWSNDPESYAGGSVATGRASLAGKVRGDDPD
jgi:hypothetical protein